MCENNNDMYTKVGELRQYSKKNIWESLFPLYPHYSPHQTLCMLAPLWAAGSARRNACPPLGSGELPEKCLPPSGQREAPGEKLQCELLTLAHYEP